jgi:hypothetical protein
VSIVASEESEVRLPILYETEVCAAETRLAVVLVTAVNVLDRDATNEDERDVTMPEPKSLNVGTGKYDVDELDDTELLDTPDELILSE